jgi:TonB family protein
MLSSICFAQDGGRTYEPPPPPAQAAEYVPNRWTTFSRIPGFAITMPGEPRASTQLLNSRFGKLTQYIYLLTTETGGYLVAYFDVPSTLNDPDAIKKALDSGRDNMLAENRRMKLLKEQEINIAGYAGKELLIEHGDMFWRQRGFVAGRRVYQIVLLMPHKVAFKSGRPSADPSDFTDFYQMIATKFLDSVRLYNFGGGSAFKLDEELKNAVSGGVLNGKAISLPKPSYPGLLDAGGTVTVQILIDEEGKVIWAKAVAGHPLLHEAARQAALKARFAPFKLKGQPVKVTGVLTYNFVR